MAFPIPCGVLKEYYLVEMALSSLTEIQSGYPA